MRIVVALGGNALLRRGEKPDALVQRHHVRDAARALAPLAAAHDLIVCHGNGPQVGLLALESESDRSLSRPYPLDVLVAQTQGMIGYWLAQELRNAGVQRPVVPVITQTMVRRDDPGFDRPTKFIGRIYPQDEAREVASRLGWSVAPDGDAWRRVVASPEPVGIVEDVAVEALVDARAVVVCCGGGGVPVVTGDGGLEGVDAVVDKDAVAALLAIRFAADRLMILTDVAGLVRGFGTAAATPIASLTTAELAAMALPAGSMGPKAAACVRFTEHTGRPSVIGSLAEAGSLLSGSSGTTVVCGADAGSER
ncbi:MAG TPA: carbamate kinase [Jatrophihabitans sp.]